MSVETSAFSTADGNAIARSIDVTPDTTADQLSQSDFDDFFDIDRTANEIIQGDYRRIALQFPDELLHNSVPIFKSLQHKIGAGRDLYVLADTSYGSCCVDEVAARHANADAMVHYGHACMSLTSHLPVVYAFGKKSLNTEHCVSQLVDAYKLNKSDRPFRNAILRHEVSYSHLVDILLEQLRTAFEVLGVTIDYAKPSSKSIPSGPDDSSSTDNYDLVFYVGSESISLTNLLMTHAFSDVFSYDPSTQTSRLESERTNKMLMRRYAVVQKARDADVFGILVGTLGVASYLQLITYLRKLLSSHHKKSYTISVGKLTPSKLANFLEIDCFVLVACPENSLIETKDFFRPIVTPYELEIALEQEVSWTGRYVLDFVQVMAEGEARDKAAKMPSNEVPDEEDYEDPDRPQFSLITGKYRHARRYGGDSKEEAKFTTDSLVLRNQGTALSRMTESAAAQILQQRTFKGLESRIGEDAPSVLEQGRSGIARGYKADYAAGKTNGE